MFAFLRGGGEGGSKPEVSCSFQHLTISGPQSHDTQLFVYGNQRSVTSRFVKPFFIACYDSQDFTGSKYSDRDVFKGLILICNSAFLLTSFTYLQHAVVSPAYIEP